MKTKLERILVQGEANNYLGDKGVIYFSTENDEHKKGDILVLGNKSGTMKTTILIFDNTRKLYGGAVIKGEIIQDRLDLTHIHK